MIPRYSRPEMAAIWSLQQRFQAMMEVELAAAEAMAELGHIPRIAAEEIRAKARFDVERIAEIEADVKHDVIAFLTNLGENIGDAARYLHLGMTSSDALDTGLSLQIRKAGDILLAGLDDMLAALAKRAEEHRLTPCIGRSHGIHAEPTSFGLKLAGHYAALRRQRDELQRALDQAAVCALSGAVGTYATIDPAVEARVAVKLGLRQEDISTQIVPRDRLARLLSALGILAAILENLAVEIRHLQRSEVREVEEPFSDGQKGSSAMPHKRNPVQSENICGLARYVRAQISPALENIIQWHERDIAHSSVERIILPDVFLALDFMLARYSKVIAGLNIYPERMLANINGLNGLIFSQRVLLALLAAGMSREDAYALVQKNAMRVWAGEGNFQELLLQDSAVTAFLSAQELINLFDLSYYLRRVDTHFARLFKG